MTAWNLSDGEWNSLKNILQPGGNQPARRGRPALQDLRPVAETCLFHHHFSLAPRYCSAGWHQMPRQLRVAASTANRYFRLWTEQGAWERFCLRLTAMRNKAAGLSCRPVRSSVRRVRIFVMLVGSSIIPMRSSDVPVIKELERAYSYFNYRFFGNGLPADIPIVLETGSRSAMGRHALGHFSAQRRKSGEPYSYRIGVNYRAFNEDPDHVCAVLLHEMVHMCNHCLGLADTCPSRPEYHNMVFRDATLRAGLVCPRRDERFGYMQTQLSEEGKKVVRDFKPKPVLAQRLPV